MNIKVLKAIILYILCLSSYKEFSVCFQAYCLNKISHGIYHVLVGYISPFFVLRRWIKYKEILFSINKIIMHDFRIINITCFGFKIKLITNNLSLISSFRG